MSNVRFKIDGISEEELDMILNKEAKYNNMYDDISNNKVEGGGCHLPPPIKNIKRKLKYDKLFSESLLNNNILGILYIINTKGYTYIKELKRVKDTKWNTHIRKLKELDLIKNTIMPKKHVSYYSRTNGFNDYHASTTKCYSLTKNAQIIFNMDYLNYISDNVGFEFIHAVEEMKEDYSYHKKQTEIYEEIPVFIDLYLKNRSNYDNKKKEDYKSRIMNNKRYSEYVKKYNIKL